MPTEGPFGVKGRRGRQADGTAGLPPAPEMARVLRHLRFVPQTDIFRRRRLFWKANNHLAHHRLCGA
jgi:hypothetical protein